MRLKDHLEKTLFRDTNFEKPDVDKTPQSVIQRLIDRGTDFQREKLIEYYGFDFVRDTMLKARYIMPFGIHFVAARLDSPLTSLGFYKLSKEMGRDGYVYKDDDFSIDEYLCF